MALRSKTWKEASQKNEVAIMDGHKLLDGKFDRSVSLLCWAYNEEESIEEFLHRATKLMESNVYDYEIILIEDGSTDNTYEIASSFQLKNPRLKIYRNEKNLNVGISSRQAIQKATKEYLFSQTIDWGYDISNLRKFLEYLKSYDIVQGVRRAPVNTKISILRPVLTFVYLLNPRHMSARSDTISKGFVSVCNYLIVRTLYGVPVSDVQNITFYPTRWIQSITFEAKSSFANPEALIKSYWSGMSIKEVPIPFIPRRKGVAKGTKIKAIIDSLNDVFKLWLKWKRQKVFLRRGTVSRYNPFEWEKRVNQ